MQNLNLCKPMLLFSVLVMGAQKNPLIVTVLLNAHNMCFG